MNEINNLTQCNEDGSFKFKQCNDQEYFFFIFNKTLLSSLLIGTFEDVVA
jgi:hypothetical protein